MRLDAGSTAAIQINGITGNHGMMPIFEDESTGAKFLIDSGAQTSLVDEELVKKFEWEKRLCDRPVKIITALGGVNEVKEEVSLAPWNSKPINAKVTKLKTKMNGILGYDWMKVNDVKFGYENNTLEFVDTEGKSKIIGLGPKEDVNACLMTKRQLKKSEKAEEIEAIWMVDVTDTMAEVNAMEVKGMPCQKPEELKRLLQEYPEVFPADPKLTGLPEPRMKLTQPAMRIDTGNAEPVKSRYYKMGPEDLLELRRQLKVLLDAKLIKPSISPWSSPVLFVKKKNNEKRMVIDYRKLNRVTKADAYPMPLIQDNLDRLGKAKVFSTMDATSGFHQNPFVRTYY